MAQTHVVLEYTARSAMATAQMRVLFDQGTPAPLRHLLLGHKVETVYGRGWSSLQNGGLIAAG